MFPFSPRQIHWFWCWSWWSNILATDDYVTGEPPPHTIFCSNLWSPKHVIQYCQGTAEFNRNVNEETSCLNCVCFVIQLWLCIVWNLIVTTVIKFEQQLMFVSVENSGMLLQEESTLVAANNPILKGSFLLLWTDFVSLWNKRIYCAILMELELASESKY